MTTDRMPDSPLRLWLVRHGRTLFNDLELAQGWSDSPLTTEGREGVVELASNLRSIQWVGTYSSTSERAMDTAEIILGTQEEIVRDRRWKEYNFGTWEARPGGMLLAELRRLSGKEGPHALRGLYFGDFPALPGGETGGEYHARVRDAIAEIRRTHPAGDVLVVTHGMTIGVAIGTVFPEYEFWRGPANATFAVIEYADARSQGILRAKDTRSPHEAGLTLGSESLM